MVYECSFDKCIYTFITTDDDTKRKDMTFDIRVVDSLTKQFYLDTGRLVTVHIHYPKDDFNYEDIRRAYSNLWTVYTHELDKSFTPSSKDVLIVTVNPYGNFIDTESLEEGIIFNTIMKTAGFVDITNITANLHRSKKIYVYPNAGGRELIRLSTEFECNAIREGILADHSKKDRISRGWDTEESVVYGKNCVKFIKEAMVRNAR